MKFILLSIFFSVILVSCGSQPQNETKNTTTAKQIQSPKLDLAQANKLAALPMNCIQIEYPNKLNQTIGGSKDLQSPKALHPAFYGCFDWHSSVHGHWSLVYLLKNFPNLNQASEIKKMLLTNISKANIEKEVAYFQGEHNKTFERTYGWAWLLKLAEELHTWDNDTARILEKNMEPLTNLLVQKYLEFLPKLRYPIRVGEHTNTGFGLAFAYDYAKATNKSDLKNLIEKRAKDFFVKDVDCPLSWEPSGYDFLSPCLQEAALMKRVLPPSEFKQWFGRFLPQLKDKKFTLAVGEVTDRKDGKLVHLDGVNFSRAWCLYNIVNDMPEYHHLKNIANAHINHSLPSLVGDSYEGGHWLGSFAIYALDLAQK